MAESFSQFKDIFGPGGFRNQPSLGDRARYAESLGFTVSGGSARRPFGVTQETINLDQFTPPQFRNGGQGNMLNTMFTALSRDIAEQQANSDLNFGQQQEVIEDQKAFVGGIGGRTSRLADETAGNLELQADQAIGLGAEQTEAARERAGVITDRITGRTEEVFRRLGKHDETLDRAEGDIDSGFSLFDKAISEMKSTIKGYSDATAAQASTMAGGIRRNLQAATTQIQNGLNPDGTLMTGAERADSMQRLNFSTNQQIQDNVTSIFSRYNEVKAQLGTQLSAITAQAAEGRLKGAALRTDIARERRAGAETGLAASQLEASTLLSAGQQMLAAESGQREMQSLSAGLHQQANAIRNSAELAAIQFEMQGLGTLGDMIRNNPRSTVSWFSGLAQMYALATAPGGRLV